MTKTPEPLLLPPCEVCGHQSPDIRGMEVREKLREAGRKRQMLTTPRERARNVAKSKKTKKYNKMQKERHEALGLRYVRGETVISNEQWAEAWKAKSPLSDLQHPSA